MTKTFDYLYKRDSKGKILEWKIEVQNNHKQVDIFMSYGELNGNHTVKYQRDIEGKNVGKANETNPWEQAIKQAKSRIKRKKREGYKSLKDLGWENRPNYSGELPTDKGLNNTLTIENFLKEYLPKDNTNLEGNLIPMKAQQYYRSKKNWTAPDGKVWNNRKYYYMMNPNVPKEKGAIIPKFPLILQPKINGVRAFVFLDEGEVIILSKKGLKYELPHIQKWFKDNIEVFSLLEGEDDVIFDGELYIHGMPLNEIGSAVKKANLNTPNVQFVIFDIAAEELTNMERVKTLSKMRNDGYFDLLDTPVTSIESRLVKTDEKVQFYTDMYINDGYEGSIQRKIDGKYQFGKRPQDMTKLKRLIDDEFEIIDIIPQDKDPNLGLYVCRTPKGGEVTITPTGTEEFKEMILFDKSSYIGKQLTCWFYEWTPENKPFHIVQNVIRDYE